MESLIITLFQSRDFAHFKHLETSSYARHMALNEYYDGIVDHMDALAELQMANGVAIRCPKSIEIPDVDEVKYFDALANTLNRLSKDTGMREDMRNVIIDIQTLVNGLLYKLKMLK